MFANRFLSVSAAVLSLLLVAGLIAAGPATAPADYKPGQKVEVREGDTWSGAQIVVREGRKYQIRYDDGTEEWVTADRVRMPGAENPADKSAGADKPAPKPVKPKAIFQNGAKIEVKWGGLWFPAQVVNRRGDWYLIEYTRDGGREWVEPWRIRNFGSQEDVPYARPNPRVNKGDNPPRDKPGEMPQENKPGSSEPFDHPVAETDLQRVNDVPASLAGSGWSYKPSPSTQTVAISEKPLMLKGGTRDESEKVTGLDLAGSTALISYKTDGWNDNKHNNIELVDLARSRTTLSAELDRASVPMAISPAGDRIFCRGNEAKTRLDVWSIAGGQLKHQTSFEPYSKTGAFWKDIEHIYVVSNDRVITSNRDGYLICWDVPKAAAVWQMKLGSAGGAAAIGPNRKALACCWDGALLLLDTSSGEVMGSIDGVGASLRAMSFSPDGTRLAALGPSVVQVFDLEHGKALPKVGLPSKTANRNFAFVGSNYLLVGSILMDSTSGLPLWSYRLDQPQAVAEAPGQLLAILKNDRSNMLCAWTLPHAGFKPSPPDGSAILRLGDGQSVALDVSIDADDATRTAITDGLKKQVIARGMQIADNAPVRVVARTENGKTEDRTYESMGGPPFARDQTKVQVTERITRLSVETNGQVLWEARTVNNASMFVTKKEGQSTADAVAESNKHNVGFLKQVMLPEIIIKPAAVEKMAHETILVPGGTREQ